MSESTIHLRPEFFDSKERLLVENGAFTVSALRYDSGVAALRLRNGAGELVMLPFYGVFDNFAYKVEGNAVTLLGQVTRPTLKSNAEAVLKRIEGVDRVNNQIEVLPVSPNDDRIRIAVYQAIYASQTLNRYALRAVPTIHIIVKGGHVTLEGAVATEADKNVANIRANGVSGVFSVKNNLHVDRS